MRLHSPKKATRAPLLQRISGIALTSWASDAVLASADILVEGQVVDTAAAHPVYHGSVMLTVPERIPGIDWEGGPEGLRLLMVQLQRSLFFRMKLLRLARAESERRCAPFSLSTVTTELEFKIEGAQLLIDIDVMGALLRAAPPVEGDVAPGGMR
ncbi:MAG: hypothetical protein GX146_08135 [Myxococcales bacterium]|nr:hypothetical protein [Myxococcales bacterium]